MDEINEVLLHFYFGIAFKQDFILVINLLIDRQPETDIYFLYILKSSIFTSLLIN